MVADDRGFSRFPGDRVLVSMFYPTQTRWRHRLVKTRKFDSEETNASVRGVCGAHGTWTLESVAQLF